jgi:hypothetical protein
LADHSGTMANLNVSKVDENLLCAHESGQVGPINLL